MLVAPVGNSNGPRQSAIVLDEPAGATEHRDIGVITPSALDGITINRTKTGVDPFIEIRKERLVDKLTGAPSRSFGVWVPDPEKPEGWKDMGVVGENYLLLTNAEVRALALEVAEASGLAFKETRIFWDGARFAHIIDFHEETQTVDGEQIGLSLITRTSYDKSWRFESALMGKRFFCDNGVISGEFFARVSFKHIVGSDDEQWKHIVRQGLGVLSSAPEDLERFVSGLRLLKKHATNDEHLRSIWSGMPRLGDTLMGKVLRRYLQEEEPTLYGLLNAGTHVFWHNEKSTSADFTNNDVFVSRMLGYAFEHLN